MINTLSIVTYLQFNYVLIVAIHMQIQMLEEGFQELVKNLTRKSGTTKIWQKGL
jgi:hypothetical protein